MLSSRTDRPFVNYSGLRPEPPQVLRGAPIAPLRTREPRACAACPPDSHRASYSCGVLERRWCYGPLRATHLAGESWQARRESNPQPPVLETGALPIELLAYVRATATTHVSAALPLLSLLGLPMHRMRSTETAIFLELKPSRRLSLVLGRAVITTFTVGARQRNDVPHRPFPSGRRPAPRYYAAGTPNAQSAVAGRPYSRRAISQPGCLRRGLASYSTISEIAPEPTVRPPSRMANRSPFSNATGVMSSISIATLSPGITISTPSGNVATPVTSVVRR